MDQMSYTSLPKAKILVPGQYETGLLPTKSSRIRMRVWQCWLQNSYAKGVGQGESGLKRCQ